MQDLSMNNPKPYTEVDIEHDPLPPAVDFNGVTPTTRYQFRALARRALSYHRRQRIANVICLILWPIILVLLCILMANMMGGHKDPDEYRGDVRFCVNEVNAQYNSDFYIPEIMISDLDTTPPATAWYPRSFAKNGRSQINPCVRWFGESYPSKAPYENASTSAIAQPDSFFAIPPAFGWFNLRQANDEWIKRDPNHRSLYLNSIDDVNQTVYYLTANDQITQVLGTPPNVTRSFTLPYSYTAPYPQSWPPTDPKIVYNASAPGVQAGTGLIGAIPVRYSSSQKYKTIEYPNGTYDYTQQVLFTAQSFTQVQDQTTLDKTILDLILQNQNDSGNPMPFGAVIYDVLDPSKSSVKATMQFGQQTSSEWSYSETSSGLRQIITMTQLTNAIATTKYNGQYVISQGLRALPYVWDNHVFDGYSLNQISVILFPFGLSFLLPTFVSILVQEKEDRHRMMMAMNGLKSSSYYMAHYLEFMTMQMILSFIFCVTAAAIKSQLIHRTSPLLIIVLLFVWAHVQISLAFVVAALFSKTRRATLVVYFLVAVSCIMGGIATNIFNDGIPFGWFIHPSFAFFNIIAKGILHASRTNGLYPLVWADFSAGTTLFSCLMLMLGESVLFLLLTFYLDAVLPSEYGVQKPWHFPISSLFKKRGTASQDPESYLASTQRASHSKDLNDDDILEGGDADVYAERDRVRTQYNPEKTPLIIQNLFHRYPGKVEPALRGMTFGVENDTVLGLLGPNGAGKSTMIHLLTGLYSPTSGTAYVAGANIRTDMGVVHSKIGVCPQHDILWGDLTVADHLLFYSRLRGIPPSLEQQAVTYAIASVSLTKFRDRQVKGLSGGEKRRVSIAIALLGDNSVIFLDEPSTGLDPAVRRVIWDIINRVKTNRTIVLTTHSMEEADILSDRIAIMTSGQLRCIGTSLHLKELYGTGFRLNVSSKPGRLQEACESIQNQILKGMKYRRIDKFTNATTFEFELDSAHQQQGRGQLSSIFGALSQTGRFPAIEDWGVSQTTLEDVFIKIVTEGDSALAMPSIVSY
ncbi:hypothetical protein BGZ80_001901 [Entomortierella chlamydospora]|uniref:ABC transporter domain-containing protein n=1 Tax=Entomortierella chlamydospora TaxID=101097 RepID=A0A9P6N1J9_9FUNG|nr:hypothetical protein BGZ80_001901 [Entomortierella chlamydospora]